MQISSILCGKVCAPIPVWRHSESRHPHSLIFLQTYHFFGITPDYNYSYGPSSSATQIFKPFAHDLVSVRGQPFFEVLGLQTVCLPGKDSRQRLCFAAVWRNLLTHRDCVSCLYDAALCWHKALGSAVLASYLSCVSDSLQHFWQRHSASELVLR